MKKGFTLAELVGVIVLLAALLLIIIPTVSKILKSGKEEMLESQITSIKQSMATWTLDNRPNDGETIYLTLSQLKKEGLVEYDIKNPVTEEYLANDMQLVIKNEDGIITYEVLVDTGSCKNDYKDVPKIDIQGSIVEYVEINSVYNDVKAIAKDKNGNILSNVVSDGNVDTTKFGSYYITYSVNEAGYCNSSIKTIIVTDTTAPVINFNGDLKVKVSEIDSYDFLSDVTVTDNSGETPSVNVESSLSAVVGKTSITYVAKDSFGNISTKVRTVIVY